MASSFIPKETQLRKTGFNLIAGIDEAGRGPMAGPLVSAAVILKKNTKLPGLDNSKKISAKKREILFDLITTRALDFSISIISHLTIDKINIVKSFQLANQLCIKNLQIKPDFVLIDGRDKQIIKTPFETIINGDSLVRCIAAASILAKVTRDRIMQHYHKIYPKYNFNKHMGYGTRLHRTILEKHGPCEIHRKTYNFKPQ